MNSVKNLLLFLVIFLVVVFSFSACSGGSGGTNHVLEGDWTLTTIPTSGSSIGSVNFSQSYFGSIEMSDMTWDMYLGSGSLSGGDINGSYTVGGSEYGGMVAFSFSDGDDDTLEFEGTLSGSTVTGTYEGSTGGKFASYEGTFTATKQ